MCFLALLLGGAVGIVATMAIGYGANNDVAVAVDKELAPLSADDLALLKDVLRCKGNEWRETAEKFRSASRLQKSMRKILKAAESKEIETQGAVETTLRALEVLGECEAVLTLSEEAIARSYESWAIYYYLAGAQTELQMYLEADENYKRSLELIDKPPSEYVGLTPNIWELHLARSKLYYEMGFYPDMVTAYLQYVNSKQPARYGITENILSSDWDVLTLPQKMRRMMRDLDMDRSFYRAGPERVFRTLIEAEDTEASESAVGEANSQ